MLISGADQLLQSSMLMIAFVSVQRIDCLIPSLRKEWLLWIRHSAVFVEKVVKYRRFGICPVGELNHLKRAVFVQD